MKIDPRRAQVPAALRRAGGLRPGVAAEVARETGVAEAQVYGVGSFYHLLSEPDVRLRVCQGLSCQLHGARGLLEEAQRRGLPAAGCSCLAACDRPVAALCDRSLVGPLDVQAMAALGDSLDAPAWKIRAAESAVPGAIGPAGLADAGSVFGLWQEPREIGPWLERSRALGAEAIVAALEASGLQGRGGAGFPAGAKWRSLLAQSDPVRYVVINADEGEPGTFKDREVLLRRPDLVVAGAVIAAEAIGAREIYVYLRGEFSAPAQSLASAVERARAAGVLEDLKMHLHFGDGAYICGEETALLEALEGKRGMPRLKPPFPTEKGLWGRPTLMHNVETIACVPVILERGAEWFKALGRTAPGSKLYCVSGHVARPGVYEMPLGVCLDELVEAAGGYQGALKAFSPGGASSGFLPAGERRRPLDFRSLAEVGSMLGSAGVVVLNESASIAEAALEQLRFFEEESCGQCAPCRIGTRFLRERLEGHLQKRERAALAQVADVAWQMNEGSICGLGQAAPLPLTSALKHFPEEFAR